MVVDVKEVIKWLFVVAGAGCFGWAMTVGACIALVMRLDRYEREEAERLEAEQT